MEVDGPTVSDRVTSARSHSHCPSRAASRNAWPPINLKRQMQNPLIDSEGRALATANTEFRRDGSRSIGRQSHVWLRTEAGWRIAAAHVSLMPASGSDAAGRKAEASAQTGSERG